MTDALIGHSGFVGTTLQRQRRFDACFRSVDIDAIRGRSFDTVVCAAAPAQKWLANREPASDRANLDALMSHLDELTCRSFVLISTVDVFRDPVDVDESSQVEEAGLHPYGLHRRLLEKHVAARFPEHLIVRLPGLIGPGLRKNVIYDFLHDNNLGSLDRRAVFQFYPMVNLWYDIERARDAGLRLVHLTAAPVSVAEVAVKGFGRAFTVEQPGQPVRYDFQTQHSGLFGGEGRYQYTTRETLQAIRSYAQSEPGSPADLGLST